MSQGDLELQSSFQSPMKPLGVLQLPLDNMQVHCRSPSLPPPPPPSILSGFPDSSTPPIYTPEWSKEQWQLIILPWDTTQYPGQVLSTPSPACKLFGSCISHTPYSYFGKKKSLPRKEFNCTKHANLYYLFRVMFCWQRGVITRFYLLTQWIQVHFVTIERWLEGSHLSKQFVQRRPQIIFW